MFIEVLIFLLFGTVIGIITGLVPGFHPNTIILFIPLMLSINSNPLLILVFIVSMAVSNIIADFIPSLIFGAADSESALGVHPAQRMLLSGRGFDAIKLSITGALGSFLLLIAIVPVLFLAVPDVYEITRPYIHYILITIVVLMIVDEKSVLKSSLIFIAAGVVGILSFQLPINTTQMLFPVLVGLFGIPSILFKLKDRLEIPDQIISVKDDTPLITKIKSIFMGTFGGVASGFLPGIGTTEIASLATVDKNNKSFLIILGSISLTNIVLSFIAIYLIDKARSGVAVAASEIISIGFNEVLIIISVAFVALSLSTFIVLYLSKKMLLKISTIDYVLLNKIILGFIVLLVFLFTGFIGIFLMILCTSLGIIASIQNVKRGLLMGVLILPTILFFAGL